jgi:hypothetical protein
VSNLKIRTYDIYPDTLDEELSSVTTIPLAVVNVVAKHIPDSLVRIITDRRDPKSGSLSFNPHTLMKMINEVLQGIETQREDGEVKGMLMEIKVMERDSEQMVTYGEDRAMQTRDDILQSIGSIEAKKKQGALKETAIEIEAMGQDLKQSVTNDQKSPRISRIVFSVE